MDRKQTAFLLDDVHYYSVYDEDIGGALSRQNAGMQASVINTAVGGDFLKTRSHTTIWPQQFLIDYVREYYEEDTASAPIELANEGFESNGPVARRLDCLWKLARCAQRSVRRQKRF